MNLGICSRCGSDRIFKMLKGWGTEIEPFYWINICMTCGETFDVS